MRVPGEDVYIITGADEEGTPATGVDAAAGADEDAPRRRSMARGRGGQMPRTDERRGRCE